MILHFGALHPHMEDDWLEACAALNGDCLYASHVGDYPDDTFTGFDSSGRDGDNGGTATLSCAMDSVDKPAICDSTANLSYAVTISNRFSSLPIEQASMAESHVEELSTPLVDTHSIDPCLNGITLPSSFQPLAPEQLGYQQLQPNSQQHNLHSHQGTIARGEFETVYTDDAPTLVHMSMPRGDALNSVTDEMDVVDQELAEFWQFCLMVKPLKNYPKVHLHGLPLDLRKTHSHLKSSAFGYSLDDEDSDEAGDEDFNSPLGSAQVPTKIKQENGLSSLHTPGATSSIPYSQCPCTSPVHSLPNSIIDSNKQRGNQLVQDLKDITRFKSTSVFGTDFSANSKPRLHRLTGSIVGIHESNVSLLCSSDVHDNIVFPQGRHSSSYNPTPTTSRGHNFTDPSINLSAITSCTSDLDLLQ